MYEQFVPACPENESFTCDNAACEKNCGNLNETCTILNNKCDNKCFCNDGFVRETPYGPCIPILKCPPNDCKINEVFECRNPTCDDEGCCIEKERPCKDVPCVNKCYCADGFVRIDGACVPRDNCFKDQCPANEAFSCGSAACEKSCGNINDTCDIVNIKCDDKCFCIDGYVRESGSNSPCIPVDNCPIVDPPPPVCEDPNAEFNQCASSCQPTCEKPVVGPCNRRCNAVCVCKKGFIQNKNGKCIKPDKCVKPSKIIYSGYSRSS